MAIPPDDGAFSTPKPDLSAPRADSPRNQPAWKRPGWKTIARIVILLLVSWGILHTIIDARAKFASHQFRIRDIHLFWIPVAMAAYGAAMLPMAAFWHRVLELMGQRPYWWETLSAYCVGQLGKYVPGKAMVVVLRSTLVRSERVDGVAAVISIFVETLTMMALGALTAAAILIVLAQSGWLIMLSLVLLVAAGIPVLPPVMRRILWVLRLRKLGVPVDQFLRGLTVRGLAGGWLGVAGSWWLMGVSLWAVIQAMPQSPSPLASLADLPLLTACTSLALVAGFVSLLPGGVLVREYVVMALLASQEEYGPLIAVVSAVLLRLTWMATELIGAAIGYPALKRLRRRTKPQVPNSQSSGS